MSKYSIPARYRLGFERLGRITQAQFATLKDLAAATPPSPDLTALLEKAASTGIEDAAEIIQSSISAASFGASRGLDAEQVANVLDVASLALSPKATGLLRRRFAALLQIPAVWLSARAVDLTSSEQRLLIDARILTDLRAIFDGDPDGENRLAPTGGMVVHHLALEVFENGEHRNWTVAVDADDLRAIRRAVDRAEQNAQALQAIMLATGMVDVTRRASDD